MSEKFFLSPAARSKSPITQLSAAFIKEVGGKASSVAEIIENALKHQQGE